MYNYFVNVVAHNQMIVMAIFFLIILLFGKIEYKLHSLVLFISSILIYFSSYDASIILSDEQYTADLMVSISWDGVTGLIMTMFLGFDKKASKQAMLLAFAVMCHTVVLLDQDIHSSFASSAVYYWFDEVIIAIGFLQMMVSKNGFIGALNNIQGLIHRGFFRNYYRGKSLFTRKERARKT